MRFAESVTRARQLLDQGLVGEVVSVSARGAPLIGEHLTQHLNQPADMGGALWIIGCHMLDVLLSIYGPPTASTRGFGSTTGSPTPPAARTPPP